MENLNRWNRKPGSKALECGHLKLEETVLVAGNEILLYP
jgi:hypothetical protein